MGVVRTGEDSPEVCPRCRRVTRRDFNFCPSCGERLQEVCSACRATLEQGALFCVKCGTHRDARAVLVAVGQPSAPGDVAFAALAAGETDTVDLVQERAEEHNARGSELYENDEFAEAVREFGAAVSLAPANAVYRTNLAVALSEMGEHSRAVAEFQEAIRLDPDNVNAYLQLGYTYQEMGQEGAARDAWQQVVQMAPDSPEAEEAREALDSL